MGGTNCKCALYPQNSATKPSASARRSTVPRPRDESTSTSMTDQHRKAANKNNSITNISAAADRSHQQKSLFSSHAAEVEQRASSSGNNAPFAGIADELEGNGKRGSDSALATVERALAGSVSSIFKVGGSNSSNSNAQGVGGVGVGGGFFSSRGSGSVHVGETGRRQRTLESKYKGDRGAQILIEEELASRATILSEYELEANRISNRHPLSPMSIASYSTEKHLVFIRHGKAYDATTWFDVHPGGKYVLLKYAGKDVSEVFDRFHSRRTKNELIKEVLIGKVWTGRGVSTCGLYGYGSGSWGDSSASGGGGASSNASHSPSHSNLHQHNSHGAGIGGGVYGLASMLSPTGSDHGDYEGRIVRIKPLTRDGSVIRIYIAFPERLMCDLGGSIVIKHKGTARNYSPCFIEETNFSLAVKRYERGIVSNYIFSKKIGDCLEFDGPYAPKALVPDKPFKTLLLIGQGTGVVPILEVARTVLAETIFFVSCYSSVSDVLFSKELSMLPESVRLIYFIPRADPAADGAKVPGLLFNSRVRSDLLTFAMGVSGGSTMTSLGGVDILGNAIPPTPNSIRSVGGQEEVRLGAESGKGESSKQGILSAKDKSEDLVPPSPSNHSPSSIDHAMVCGSFTFFDDVKRMLEQEMGIAGDRILQL